MLLDKVLRAITRRSGSDVCIYGNYAKGLSKFTVAIFGSRYKSGCCGHAGLLQLQDRISACLVKTTIKTQPLTHLLHRRLKHHRGAPRGIRAQTMRRSARRAPGRAGACPTAPAQCWSPREVRGPPDGGSVARRPAPRARHSPRARPPGAAHDARRPSKIFGGTPRWRRARCPPPTRARPPG